MHIFHVNAPYSCEISGCVRVRGKSYFRRKDLIKHRKCEYPNASKFKVHCSCRLPRCLRYGENQTGIYNHYVKEHGYSISFAERLTS